MCQWSSSLALVPPPVTLPQTIHRGWASSHSPDGLSHEALNFYHCSLVVSSPPLWLHGFAVNTAGSGYLQRSSMAFSLLHTLL